MQEGMHACQALAFHLAASCFAPYSRNHCQCRPASALKLVGKTPNSRVQTCRFPKADVRYKHWATLIIRKEAYGPPELPRLNRLAPQLTGKSAPQAPLAAFGASGAGTALRYKRQAYKDLALYGVDEADFDFVQQLPASRQKRIQAVGKVGGKSEGGSVQSLGTSSVSEQKGIGSKHSESADSRGWLAYLLLSCDERTTLVGVTNDLSRRLRQQNGHIKGGAKLSSAGRPWKIVCTVKGFSSKSEAFQFEWAWENMTKAAVIKHKVLPEEHVKGCKYLKAPALAIRQSALEHARSGEDFTNLQVEWELEEAGAG